MSKVDDSELRAKLSQEIQARLKERVRRAQASVAPALLIHRRAKLSPLPLSCMEEWVWQLIERSQPGTHAPTTDAAYLMPTALRLKGRLNIGALESSFDELTRRHETLRTSFSNAEGQRMQVIAAPSKMSVPVVDLSTLPEAGRETAVHSHIAEEVQRPFDLTCAPLIRARLLRLDEMEHVLLLTMHHIISDGWSMSVLGQELSTLYKAFSANQPSPLADLQIQYGDYTLWQHDWLRSEAAERELRYWKQRLAGASFALEMPTDHPRPVRQSFRGAKQLLVIPESLTEALKELSRRLETTLFMTLLAAFNVLVHWFTEQHDILIGTHVTGRLRPEIEGMIGNFLNNLVLRTDLSGDPCFEDLLAQVRENSLQAFSHQKFPFVKLVQHLQPEPPPNRSPLVQVFFLLQNFPPSAIDLPGITSTSLNTGGARGTRDLSLTITERAGELIAALQYDAALFEPSTIQRLLAAFERLLNNILAHPQARFSSFQLFNGKHL
jgi:hypothetical protein